jgi:hypothetical protein
MRKISQYARDFEKDPKFAQLPSMMKKVLKTLIDRKMLKGKKDFYALTSHGRACAQGDMVHTSTASNSSTSP